MDTVKDKILDLKFQLESVSTERKGLSRQITVIEIDLQQKKLRRTALKEKEDLLRAEIYSLERIGYFK